MNTLLKRHSRRFTLIELLVVIAIIAILAALLLPTLARAKYQAKLVICLGHQKQIALGFMQYADDYNMWYPYPGCAAGDTCTEPSNSSTHASLNGKRVRQGVRSLKTDHWNNMREDVEMTYFGGIDGARSLFMCPIVEPEYNLNNVRSYTDSNGIVKKQFPFRPIPSNTIRWVPFATYFNINPGRASFSRAMRKVGQTWTFGTGSRVLLNSRGKESDILISDFMSRTSNSSSATVQISNHYQWGSSAFTSAGGITNWNTVGFGYDSYEPTNANYIRTDGSGENVKGLHQAFRTDTTGGSVVKYGGGVVPVSYLE